MRKAGLTLLALVACGGLAACGSDDDDGGGGSSSADAAPAALTFVMSGSGRAVDMAIEGEPAAGLTRLTFRNDARGDHEAQLVRVEGTHSDAEVLRQFAQTGNGAPTPDWLRAAGGTGPATSGQEVSSTQVLQPGTYYAVDSNTEGRPPFVKFEITGEASDDELPAADATITAEDYSFTTSGLRAGTNEITFENTGEEIHHVIALPLGEGRTIEDVRAFFLRDRGEGRPPFDFARGAGTSAFDGGTGANVELRLQSGDYALLCFISDRRGGPPHALMGMISEATVE